MSRHWLIALALAALLANGVVAGDGRKPNVLFLFADDMRADSIAALGNPAVKTPNLDTLVQRGFAFRNAYCLGGNSPAVCTPSRNMLLSGNAYYRWKDYKPPQGQPGLLSPGEGPNFPLSMKAAGYETYHHGKRGNTAPLIQAKFDVNRYLADDQAERRSGEPGKEIVDAAITYLGERKADGPFFMYLAFGNPHDPRVAAKPYLDQYQADALPLPKNFQPLHPFDIGSNTVRDETLLPWPRTEADVRRTHHEYYATITAMDFHIGRLLALLKERGLLENTLVVFSADQGISIGSHGLLGKQNLYDPAMKAPLVVAGPGIPHGTSNALVYLFDIYPTVCDLVRAEVPGSVDGRSVKAVFHEPKSPHRDELLLSYMTTQRAIRTDRWKLIRYPQVDVTQLFDLQTDPDETRDLSKDPAQAERIRDLTSRLKALQAKFDDAQPLFVPNPKPAAWTPPLESSL